MKQEVNYPIDQRKTYLRSLKKNILTKKKVLINQRLTTQSNCNRNCAASLFYCCKKEQKEQFETEVPSEIDIINELKNSMFLSPEKISEKMQLNISRKKKSAQTTQIKEHNRSLNSIKFCEIVLKNHYEYLQEKSRRLDLVNEKKKKKYIRVHTLESRKD